MALTQAELDAAQTQINAARAQTHANIAAAKGWADLAKAAADASGVASAQAALANANRAEQARALAQTARADAQTARGGADAAWANAQAARSAAEGARDTAVTAVAGVNTAVQAMKNEILGGVGPAFDTLAELKADYENADDSLTALIGGKAEKSDPRFTDARPPTSHQHGVDDLTGSGTRSATTYYNGLGTFSTPPNDNTTYPALAQSDADGGVSTSARTITAVVLKGAVQRWVTGQSDVAVTNIGMSLNRATNALLARMAIGAEQEGWQGTTAQYNALATKETNRSYYLTD